jgi:hypothetical protein
MNAPFDRTTINQRERPSSSDINIAQSQLDRTLREILRREFAGRNALGPLDDAMTAKNGFIGDSFMATPKNPTAMALNLRAGFAFIDAPTDVPTNIGTPPILGCEDLAPYKPIVLLADQLVNIQAAPGAGLVRVDLIEVTYDRFLTDQAQRDVLDPTFGIFTATNVYKTLSFDVDGLVGQVNDPAPSTAAIGYKVGSPIAVGGFNENTPGPTPTPGYIAIAEIVVFDTTVAITRENIRDKRKLVMAGNVGRISVQATIGTTLGNAPSVFSVLECPNGIDLAALGPIDNARAALGRFDLYAMLGSAPLKVGVASARVANDLPALGTNVGYFISSAAAAAKIDTGAQGQINSAGRSFDPYKPAIGQNAALLSVQALALKNVAGVINADALPNPMTYDLGLVFIY